MGIFEWFFAVAFLSLVVGYLVIDNYMVTKKGFDLTRRLKYFLISIVAIPMGCLFAWFTIDGLLESLDLSENGVEVVAVVKQSNVEHRHRRKRMRTYYKNTVVFAGTKKTFDLDRAYEVGTKLYIVYSTKNPKIAKVTRLRNGVMDYFFDGKDVWDVVILLILPFLFFTAGIRSLIFLFKKESVLDGVDKG